MSTIVNNDTDDYATRREFDQLAQRVSMMDQHGTRGVGVVQVQLTEVIKDVARLETEMNARFSAHHRQHEKEQLQREANRRWAVGLAVAVLAAVGGLYPYLHAIARH